MTIGELRKAMADKPADMRVITTDSNNQGWVISRVETGTLSSDEEVFVITRFHKPFNKPIDTEDKIR